MNPLSESLLIDVLVLVTAIVSVTVSPKPRPKPIPTRKTLYVMQFKGYKEMQWQRLKEKTTDLSEFGLLGW